MADLPNDVRYTWQLVSQFVSWEFCRFISENNDDSNSEIDVLALLRNMIVQRTEKSVCDVTKHEIIAKFIMEIKAIKIFQVSSVIPLSESVKKICPELSSAVGKLIHHLETFYDLLESTDESRKELIRLRIEGSISDFSKEASRQLPRPDLLQVVDSWNEIHHHHNHPHPQPLRKPSYNRVLLEKVLECLHIERVTASEAEQIAIALMADKTFENILLNATAESETEADSEPLSLSQLLQQMYSQEFMKNTHHPKAGVNLLNDEPLNLQVHTQIPLPVDNSPLQLSDGSPVQHNDVDLMQHDDVDLMQHNDVDLIQHQDPSNFVAESPPASPQEYPFIHSNASNQNRNIQLQKSLTSPMQFAQSVANESDDDSLHRIYAKVQRMHEAQMRQNNSDFLNDSDTSDCDKNANFKFLTPTYFKEGATEHIHVSDLESFDSTVIASVSGSQKADPNWSTKQTSLLPATQYVRPNKRKIKKTPPIKKKKPVRPMSPDDSDENLVDLSPSNKIKKLPSVKKNPVRVMSSDDSGESIVNPSPIKSPYRPSTSATRTRAELLSECPLSGSHTRAQDKSPHLSSTSSTHSRADFIRPFKKRKMTKALYRSPTLCIDDFVSVLRKPNKRKMKKTSPVKKKKPVRPMSSDDSGENCVNLSPSNKIKKTSPGKKKPVRVISSDDSDENIVNPSPIKLPYRPSTSATCTRAELLSECPLSLSASHTGTKDKSPHLPSTSSTHNRGPFKKRKMTKALYRSPTLCIDDFVSVLRKPNSEPLSDVSVPNVKTVKKGKKAPAATGFDSTKRLKCKQCNKTYKTSIALRRHVFLKHTDPPEDSDCET